jgi:hypothetical protein
VVTIHFPLIGTTTRRIRAKPPVSVGRSSCGHGCSSSDASGHRSASETKSDSSYAGLVIVPHQPADVEAGADGPGPEPDAPKPGVRAESIIGALASAGGKAQPALVVNRLTKRFGERTAFSEVSFDVAPGRSSASWAPTAQARPPPCALSAP